MPALVVWERSIFAGDDLRLISMITFSLRVFQICLVSYIIHQIIQFEHKPETFIETGCLNDEDRYWLWYSAIVIGCFLTLFYSFVGALIEVAIFKISGRGTPTETEKRRHLVPICKCYMVPMLFVRTLGFIFLIVSLTVTNRFCKCAYHNSSREGEEFLSACPTDDLRTTAIILIFTMACDVLFPFITLVTVTKQKIRKVYRRIRPRRDRSIEDVQRSWQTTCKRLCECSALMTCYMFGGQKLTSGSYGDVAIALADFLDDEGSLDIVTSDIAAALICLVNIQKQKQIDCKHQLLQQGGLFAKDRKLADRLWKQFISSDASHRGHTRHSGSAASLKETLDMTMAGDVESGGQEVAMNISQSKMKAKDNGDEMGSHISSLSRPTDADLRKILTNKDAMQSISYRLIHEHSHVSFEPTMASVLSPRNVFDCFALGEGSRYCAVALASYSWMMYLWTKKCTGCCELTASSHPRCCRSDENLIGDNICGWKKATVLKTLQIDESNLLYANFCNDVGVNPYFIVKDDEWKTIVLTIRGTLSFEDMISDVTLTPKPLDEIGEEYGFDGRGEFCHSGFLAGACWIYDDLKRHRILDEALEAHSDFGLRIIGHSLGAGVAAMLGRMLRQQYPNLYCLCFSPPGCVFSERTAKESKDYVCSYVLHNDIVPRLSYESLVNFRNDLIEMIARIKCPKHKVFDANFRPWNEKALLSLPETLLYSKADIPATKFYNEFERFKLRQSERQQERGGQQSKMSAPGKIMHMVRTSARLDNVPCSCILSCMKCIVCCGFSPVTKKYKVRWIDSKDLTEIYISPTMMADHFPYNIAHALDIAAESYGAAGRATTMYRDGDGCNLEGANMVR